MLNYFFKVKESGAAMPAVILAMAASAGVITTLSGTFDNREIEGTRGSIKIFQRLIHNRVLSAASNPINIYNSINDRNFRNCVEIKKSNEIENDPVDCRRTDYRLFDARMFYNGRNNSTVISGNSVAYNIRGVRCANNETVNCPFRVRTAYKINCYNNETRCNVAESITVKTEVSWVAGRYENKRIDPNGKLSIASYPKQAATSSQNFPQSSDIISTMVFPSDIMESIFQQCPLYSTSTGYDPKGILKCKCIPGFKSIGKRGVKLACESDLQSEILDTRSVFSYTSSIGRLSYGVNGSIKYRKDIQCRNNYRLVSVSGLKSNCWAGNSSSRNNPNLRCTHEKVTYKCAKFKEENRWLK